MKHSDQKPDFEKWLKVLVNYDHLSNNDLIAATCKHHGIGRIATFDEDFKRVGFFGSNHTVRGYFYIVRAHKLI